MKFARYLEESQTPEWKKAYIDYRGLKKRISAIRDAQQTGISSIAPQERDNLSRQTELDERSRRASSSSRGGRSYGSIGITPPLHARDGVQSPPPLPTTLPPPTLSFDSQGNSDPSTHHLNASSHGSITRQHANRSHTEDPTAFFARRSRSFTTSADDRGDGRGTSGPSRFLASIRRGTSWKASDGSGPENLPLSMILPTLTHIEKDFFDALDRELDKIEKFYRARESEAMVRATALKEQLRELQDHRRIFHEVHDNDGKWGAVALPRVIVDHMSNLPIPVGGSKRNSRVSPQVNMSRTGKVKEDSQDRNGKQPERSESPGVEVRRDPEDYKQAKKGLKRAILEYYRGLQLLNDYRVLNLTGFRKALKKFEKVVKRVWVQRAYMQEKVEICAFSSGETIESMMKEMEAQYAAFFERGDAKKARNRLRASTKTKSHHFSTFRTGLYLGLAIPAVVSGIYESFQPDIRTRLPWNSLLLVYAALMIPMIFALFVGLNILVWSRTRINYGFIFELDVRTQLDSREYFELPAFLLSTLSYSFWLSFKEIGPDPTDWPIIWMAFATIVIINPLPILYPSSRWWLIRNVGKLLASGTMPVEFTDFWLGDQFCSLVFTLSNLFFIGCAYVDGWGSSWNDCSSRRHWGAPFALASLPLVVRAVQSVKRYSDSHLNTHLINGGKYFTGIIYYAVYFSWRHSGSPHNWLMALFCLTGTLYSIYAASWDMLMDWSLLKRPAQYPLLRQELVYTNHIPLYYFALVTNLIIRFSWIIYIPSAGVDPTLRTFIAAIFEMLRRCQWNFFRLENEHIGNTDQYRVTREVPLPYSFHDGDNISDDDGGDEEDENFTGTDSWRRRRPVRLPRLRSQNMDASHAS